MTMAGTALTVDPGRRVAALDALRGVAVVGIVPMNVIAVSMPWAAYVNPRAFGGSGPLETVLWALSFVLIEDKFRTLFAMMFGAGVAILLDRATTRPLFSHWARMGALLAIAMAHAILLANNDVLRSYAIAGLILPLAIHWKVRWLLAGAAAIMVCQLAVSGYLTWNWLTYWFRIQSGEVFDPQYLAQAERRFGANPEVIGFGLDPGQESFAERIDRRTSTLGSQAVAVAASVPSAMAAMLVGIALWRNGLLAGEWDRARAFRLWRNCAILTLPTLVFLALWTIDSGFSPIIAPANALIWSAPFDLVLGVGYAALAMALFGGVLRHRPLTSVWSAAGRMALTNYLATSFVFAAIFASWGLGLFGKIDRPQALLITLVPIALMLLWSPWWLARFRQGPAEWLWRSLAAGKPLPFSLRK